jgi:hypothetical protein
LQAGTKAVIKAAIKAGIKKGCSKNCRSPQIQQRGVEIGPEFGKPTLNPNQTRCAQCAPRLTGSDFPGSASENFFHRPQQQQDR